ncbi:hypothetical protein [Rossellomorea aquimaris]|uniref:Uncharacterized protein n=1 Tax=Rossellomorea aquimaris TaxID=189382 RepID=A0A5D4TSL8_9BACI|nr:hypothetical protein [Rossellomorea aquimaris]TYS77818.1 hypothetical protein FZD05_14520 [Rossellomorea aquimaris]TYS87000.1 hypothetical protein FZC85_08415 [Rossellomorea aquimaris]
MIYLFSLLALILLLPILYFIPIGISVKGKLFIAGIAFGLTLLGLVASTQYSIWMIGIMLMVLLGLSSYVIEQRFSGLIVLTAGTEMDLEEEPVKIVHKHKGLKDHLHNKKDESQVEEEKLELIEDTVDSAQVEVEMAPIEMEDLYEIEVDVAEEDSENDTAIEQDEPLQASEIKKIIPTVETESMKVDDDESEWFIENANEYEDIGKMNETEEENESPDIVLSEIERLINEPDETIENEKEEMKEAFDDKSEAVEDLEGLLASEDELEDALVDDFVEDEKAEISEGTKDRIVEDISEEDLHVHAFPERSRIMREVMKTMIEQITLSKSILSSHQMENMIKHYLHPSLHDQDYYTFARILMDHYISKGQYEDLHMFTDGIAKRFIGYPYIKMDIEQTNEFAWKKLNEIKMTE